jgi:hypothetical protein
LLCRVMCHKVFCGCLRKVLSLRRDVACV